MSVVIDTPVLLKCGHLSDSVNISGSPSCSNCVGIREGWNTPVYVVPFLIGRIAACKICGTTRFSAFNLPGFEYRGIDSWYGNNICALCGCTLKQHRWGGRYEPDAWGRKGAVNPDLCIHRGLNFSPIGDTLDAFFCGCDDI